MLTTLEVVVCILFDWFLPLENSFLFLLLLFVIIKSTGHTENSKKGKRGEK